MAQWFIYVDNNKHTRIMYHFSANVLHSQFLLRHKVVQFAILISETEQIANSLEGVNGQSKLIQGNQFLAITQQYYQQQHIHTHASLTAIFPAETDFAGSP